MTDESYHHLIYIYILHAFVCSGAMAAAAVNHQSAKGANGSTSPSPCLSLLDAAAAGGACSSGQLAVMAAAVSGACCGGDCAAATKALLPQSVVFMPPSATTTTTTIPPWPHHCRDQVKIYIPTQIHICQFDRVNLICCCGLKFSVFSYQLRFLG